METKICIKCGQEKPLNEKNFYFRKDSNKFRNDCIDCIKRIKEIYYLNNREIILEYKKDYNLLYPEKQREYDIKRGQSTGVSQSLQEKEIEQFLKDNNIKFEIEKTFDDCRSKRNCLLSFDFYIPNLNILLEFDGIFHSQSIFSNFKRIQENDQIKNIYCLIKGIQLIRISYKEDLQEELCKILDYATSRSSA